MLEDYYSKNIASKTTNSNLLKHSYSDADILAPKALSTFSSSSSRSLRKKVNVREFGRGGETAAEEAEVSSPEKKSANEELGRILFSLGPFDEDLSSSTTSGFSSNIYGQRPPQFLPDVSSAEGMMKRVLSFTNNDVNNREITLRSKANVGSPFGESGVCDARRGLTSPSEMDRHNQQPFTLVEQNQQQKQKQQEQQQQQKEQMLQEEKEIENGELLFGMYTPIVAENSFVSNRLSPPIRSDNPLCFDKRFKNNRLSPLLPSSSSGTASVVGSTQKILGTTSSSSMNVVLPLASNSSSNNKSCLTNVTSMAAATGPIENSAISGILRTGRNSPSAAAHHLLHLQPKVASSFKAPAVVVDNTVELGLLSFSPVDLY